MSISAKAMAITGIDDRRYWNWIPTEESRLVSQIFSFGIRGLRLLYKISSMITKTAFLSMFYITEVIGLFGS